MIFDVSPLLQKTSGPPWALRALRVNARRTEAGLTLEFSSGDDA